jgi:signal transducing adaptor molecule
VLNHRLQNTHAAVKSKVLEKMAEWTEMFKNDPGLGIMEQAYDRVKSAS